MPKASRRRSRRVKSAQSRYADPVAAKAHFDSLSTEERDRIQHQVIHTVATNYNGPLEPDYEEKAIAAYENLPLRPGGHMGSRWTPICGQPTTVSHGWLEFIYWDVQVPFGPQQRTSYNIQVCLAGHSPEEPFDYVLESVKVEFWDMAGQCNIRARAEDNPEAYIGFSGDVFVITYPQERGQLDDFVTRKLQLPV